MQGKGASVAAGPWVGRRGRGDPERAGERGRTSGGAAGGGGGRGSPSLRGEPRAAPSRRRGKAGSGAGEGGGEMLQWSAGQEARGAAKPSAEPLSGRYPPRRLPGRAARGAAQRNTHLSPPCRSSTTWARWPCAPTCPAARRSLAHSGHGLRRPPLRAALRLLRRGRSCRVPPLRWARLCARCLPPSSSSTPVLLLRLLFLLQLIISRFQSRLPVAGDRSLSPPPQKTAATNNCQAAAAKKPQFAPRAVTTGCTHSGSALARFLPPHRSAGSSRRRRPPLWAGIRLSPHPPPPRGSLPAHAAAPAPRRRTRSAAQPPRPAPPSPAPAPQRRHWPSRRATHCQVAPPARPPPPRRGRPGAPPPAPRGPACSAPPRGIGRARRDPGLPLREAALRLPRPELGLAGGPPSHRGPIGAPLRAAAGRQRAAGSPSALGSVHVVWGLFVHVVVQEELSLTDFMTNFQNKAELFRFSLIKEEKRAHLFWKGDV